MRARIENEARVIITWAGQTGDLPNTVANDTTDADVRRVEDAAQLDCAVELRQRLLKGLVDGRLADGRADGTDAEAAAVE